MGVESGAGVDTGADITSSIVGSSVIFIIGIIILSGAIGTLADSHTIGTVSFTENPDDGDTVTIDGTVFEFDNDGSVTAGRTAVGLGENAVGTYNNFTVAVTAAGYEVI